MSELNASSLAEIARMCLDESSQEGGDDLKTSEAIEVIAFALTAIALKLTEAAA